MRKKITIVLGLALCAVLVGSKASAVTAPRLTTPKLWPSSGSYPVPVNVAITHTEPGVTIYYTTNGTIPTTASPQYSAPIAVSSRMTIRAIAVKNGFMNSYTTTGSYYLRPGQVSIPRFQPSPGLVRTTEPVNVSITAYPLDSQIYYTTNGTIPTTSSLRYTAPFPINQSTTIRARAFASGMNPSVVSYARYTLLAQKAATPRISPYGGTFSAPVNVTISDATLGTTIWYTTDGSNPVPGAPALQYSGPFTITSSAVIKAIATKPGAYLQSDMATATLTIRSAPIPTAAITANGSSNSLSVSQGTPVTIAWSSQNLGTGGYCSVTPTPSVAGSWSGTSGSQTLSTLTAGSYTFRVNCGNSAGQSATAQVAVTVTASTTPPPPPPVVGNTGRGANAKKVRAFYLIPSDKANNPAIPGKIHRLFEHLQIWTKNQLGNGKTFSFAPIQTKNLPRTSAAYSQGTAGAMNFWNNVLTDAGPLTGAQFYDPNNMWVYFVDATPAQGQIIGGTSALAMLAENDLAGINSQNACRSVGGTGHELGHALGRPHPAGCDQSGQPGCDFNALMYLGYLSYTNTYWTADDKNYYNASPFFAAEPTVPDTLFSCSSL